MVFLQPWSAMAKCCNRRIPGVSQLGPPFSHHFFWQIFQVLSYCQTSGLGGRDAAWWPKIWQNPWQSGLSKNQGCAPQVKRHFLAKMMFSDKATYQAVLFALSAQSLCLSGPSKHESFRIGWPVLIQSHPDLSLWMSQKWIKSGLNLSKGCFERRHTMSIQSI